MPSLSKYNHEPPHLNQIMKLTLLLNTLRFAGILFASMLFQPAFAQIDEDQLGIWTAYSWSTRFADSQWGLQGDVQLRNWDIYRDTEQYLARGGVTYSSRQSSNTFQLGIASVTSTEFGEGESSNTENRIFQDLSIRQTIGERVNLRHRFRAEQRWIEQQKFRTRYRYSIAATIPLNTKALIQGAWYLALNNEFFLNGERDIGHGRRVDYFDRNRSAIAVGHVFDSQLRLQLGYMHQWTDNIDKGQLQLSLTQRF